MDLKSDQNEGTRDKKGLMNKSEYKKLCCKLNESRMTALGHQSNAYDRRGSNECSRFIHILISRIFKKLTKSKVFMFD